jgi:hypothetical protein
MRKGRTTMNDDELDGQRTRAAIRARREAPMRKVTRPIMPIPLRMLNLPRDPRGVPIPWFAGRDADGHLRVTKLDRAAKWDDAVENRRCWMCGARLGRLYTFVLGPIQTFTYTVTEPPSHADCARYAVRVCPFLSNPARGRFDGVASQSGAPVNPGVFVLWQTLSFDLGDRKYMLVVGEPVRVAWWTWGRPATDAEVEAAKAVARRYCPEETEP